MDGTVSTPSERVRVRRLADRGRYDRETIDRILDEALICHVAFVTDGGPVVIPTIHARVADTLYLHGSPASRMLRATIGEPVCYQLGKVGATVEYRTAKIEDLEAHSQVEQCSAIELRQPRLEHGFVDGGEPESHLGVVAGNRGHVRGQGEVIPHLARQLHCERRAVKSRDDVDATSPLGQSAPERFTSGAHR